MFNIGDEVVLGKVWSYGVVGKIGRVIDVFFEDGKWWAAVKVEGIPFRYCGWFEHFTLTIPKIPDWQI